MAGKPTLQCQPICRVTHSIFAPANQTAGYFPLELLCDGKESTTGNFITNRNTKSRRVAKNDISTPFTWRLKKCQSKKICRDNDQCACFMYPGLLSEITVVGDEAVHVGVLDKDTSAEIST